MLYALLVTQKVFLTGTVMAALWVSPAEIHLAQNNPDAMLQPPGLTIEDGYYPALLSPTAVDTMDAYFNPKPPSARTFEEEEEGSEDEERGDNEPLPDSGFPGF